jgi:thiol-disulfide isomerase/thioredoxin
VERLLLLAGLAIALALLALAASGLARRRRSRLRRLGAATVWQALSAAPDGRPTVVAFSTPSCAACHSAQKPALAALQSRAGAGVRVVEVDSVAQPGVAEAFGVLTVPATAVLDRTGRVAALNQGFASADRLADQLGLAPATASASGMGN